MFLKSALVVLLVAALAVVAFGEDTDVSCYNCLASVSANNCVKVDKDTEVISCPTKECYTVVATWKNNQKSIVRSCFSPSMSCEKLGKIWESTTNQFACQSCNGNKCNTAELTTDEVEAEDRNEDYSA